MVSNDGDTEGFGLVFVESIGSGCYTIATDLPAVADIVVDGKSGFIVTQRSSDEIAMTVLKILSNPKNMQ
ncbi:glycosyltransferase [Candidatus Reidiella endopervernicosa]|uniref:glycosyltransferase n=1 Tax=Candidatus Reidiella endopervernicosa TaxID=2738883 RepID=UPI003B9687D5